MKQKELWVAYALWFFCGLLGIHKFYLGKIVVGILYFFTGGLLFIGWFVDLFTLPSQVEFYNLKMQNLHDFRSRRNYQGPDPMEEVIRKTRGIERRLQNVEDIVTSEEYNFHRKLNKKY